MVLTVNRVLYISEDEFATVIKVCLYGYRMSQHHHNRYKLEMLGTKLSHSPLLPQAFK